MPINARDHDAPSGSTLSFGFVATPRIDAWPTSDLAKKGG
jgi:hypothetical protein